MARSARIWPAGPNALPGPPDSTRLAPLCVVDGIFIGLSRCNALYLNLPLPAEVLGS